MQWLLRDGAQAAGAPEQQFDEIASTAKELSERLLMRNSVEADP